MPTSGYDHATFLGNALTTAATNVIVVNDVSAYMCNGYSICEQENSLAKRGGMQLGQVRKENGQVELRQPLMIEFTNLIRTRVTESTNRPNTHRAFQRQAYRLKKLTTRGNRLERAQPSHTSSWAVLRVGPEAGLSFGSSNNGPLSRNYVHVPSKEVLRTLPSLHKNGWKKSSISRTPQMPLTTSQQTMVGSRPSVQLRRTPSPKVATHAGVESVWQLLKLPTTKAKMRSGSVVHSRNECLVQPYMSRSRTRTKKRIGGVQDYRAKAQGNGRRLLGSKKSLVVQHTILAQEYKKIEELLRKTQLQEELRIQQQKRQLKLRLAIEAKREKEREREQDPELNEGLQAESDTLQVQGPIRTHKEKFEGKQIIKRKHSRLTRNSTRGGLTTVQRDSHNEEDLTIVHELLSDLA